MKKMLTALYLLMSSAYAGVAPDQTQQQGPISDYVRSFAKDNFGSFLTYSERDLVNELKFRSASGLLTHRERAIAAAELRLLLLTCNCTNVDVLNNKNVINEPYWTQENGKDCRETINFFKYKYNIQ